MGARPRTNPLTRLGVRVTSWPMTNLIQLAQGFEAPDLSAWQDLALKALKGAPLERLTSKTHDGVAIKPLYTAADVSSERPAQPAAARDPFLPWDIRQAVLDADPTQANQIALYDLERGVSSVEFVLDPSGACGVAARNADEIATLLKGLYLDIATVSINAPQAPLEAASLLVEAIAPAQRKTAKIAFNLDPAGQTMVGGSDLPMGHAIAFAHQNLTDLPAATTLRADARPVHEGGGSEAQELAVLIASGLDYLRAGESLGMTPAQVNQTLLFTLSVGPDVVVEIAKLKAARRLWGRVLQACGVDAPMRLQGVTSGRMQTVADPWTNILRATCATFAAGAGGADIVTVLPFTSAYEVANQQARRIARNTQLILQEESHLGTVADPAAGAWAMEAIADDLAKAAWALVQEIERAGGLGAALDSGFVQGRVAAIRSARERDVAKRKTALVGVSIFPNINEILPLPPLAGEVPRRGDGGLDTEAPSGAARHLPRKTGEELGLVIPPMRLSAPFEALRAKPNGAIFLATLGPIAKFNARSGFAKNAFEAGGIEAIGGEDIHDGDQAIIAAFTKSGAKIICLCGDDDTYQSRAAPLAQALKHAGAKAVWLAGKGDYQSVDRTIFAGADILAELTFAHQILEGGQ
jgi:methylmalonyl-CoA mutase